MDRFNMDLWVILGTLRLSKIQTVSRFFTLESSYLSGIIHFNSWTVKWAKMTKLLMAPIFTFHLWVAHCVFVDETFDPFKLKKSRKHFFGPECPRYGESVELTCAHRIPKHHLIYRKRDERVKIEVFIRKTRLRRPIIIFVSRASLWFLIFTVMLLFCRERNFSHFQKWKTWIGDHHVIQNFFKTPSLWVKILNRNTRVVCTVIRHTEFRKAYDG